MDEETANKHLTQFEPLEPKDNMINHFRNNIAYPSTVRWRALVTNIHCKDATIKLNMSEVRMYNLCEVKNNLSTSSFAENLL